MDDGVIPLANDFAAADETAWRRLVDKTLNGQEFDKRLVAKSYDGLKIGPLYTTNNALPPLALAPAARQEGRWDVRVRVDHPDLVVANGIALEELVGGANSLLICIDPAGESGVALGSSKDFQALLEGVHIDLATVALDAGPYGLEAARWLLEVGEARTLRPKLALHLDPLSVFAETGVAAGGISAQLSAAGALSVQKSAESIFLASGRVVHEAGGAEAAELGFAVSSALAYARSAMKAGLSAEAAFSLITLGLAADGEYFTTLAKHRAAEALWARITSATVGRPLAPRIETRSSRRMLSALDPWVNMLRLTAAGFSAACGGAQAIVLDPFSQPLGRATSFARRQSRNTQLVLMEESHLGRVSDPAAGSWYIETLSRQLAKLAWTFMQSIETAGGAGEALERGLIAEDVERAKRARERDIQTRKSGLIGVSEFPDLAEAGVDLDFVDPKPFARPAPIQLMGADSRCSALKPWRASIPFEALRRRAAEIPHPKVYLATIGAPADYSARVGFARNLFAAGGISAEVGEVLEYTPQQSVLAVLCSSDGLYAERAVGAAQALRRQGARHLYLAGRPGALQDALEQANVQHFLYAGMDAVEVLARALDALGGR